MPSSFSVSSLISAEMEADDFQNIRFLHLKSTENCLLTVYPRVGAAFGPMGQCVDCYLIGVEFTIRIGEHATQQRYQFGRTASVWTEKYAFLIVIVRMQIIPNDGRSAHYFSHFLDRFNGQLLRNYFWSRPQNVDFLQRKIISNQFTYDFQSHRLNALESICCQSCSNIPNWGRTAALVCYNIALDRTRSASNSDDCTLHW